MDNDFEIYKDRTYSSLIQSIIESTERRRDQVSALIEDLRVLIKGPGDICIIVPFIKDYLSVGTDNDANLTKLAGILIKISVSSTAKEGEDGFLSPEDRKQLLEAFDQQIEVVKVSDIADGKKLDKLNNDVKKFFG